MIQLSCHLVWMLLRVIWFPAVSDHARIYRGMSVVRPVGLAPRNFFRVQLIAWAAIVESRCGRASAAFVPGALALWGHNETRSCMQPLHAEIRCSMAVALQHCSAMCSIVQHCSHVRIKVGRWSSYTC